MIKKRYYILIASASFLTYTILKESHTVNRRAPSISSTNRVRIKEKTVYTKKLNPKNISSKKNLSSSYDKLLYKNTIEITQQLKLLDLKENKEAKFLLFANMTELLKHKPELCMDLARNTLKLDQNHRDHTLLMATLIGAIASSKTPQAERALAFILTHKNNEKASIQSAIYLNNFPNPSSISIEALNTVLDSQPRSTDLYRASSLALGSVSSFSSKQTSKKIVSDILRRATTDSSKKNIAIYLASIGNSGSAEALDYLRPHLYSKDSHIRSKAILSLRHMKTEEALNLFTNSFLHEEDSRVLKASLQNFRYLEASDLFLKTIYSSVLKHENNAEISNAILKNSYLNLKQRDALSPSYRAMLVDLSRSSSKEHTIQLVESILTSRP